MPEEKPRAVVFIADGFEEIEAITVIDILRRAEINTLTVSITGKTDATGSHGVRLVCDSAFDSARSEIDGAEILVLPGGPGTDNLKDHKGLGEAIVRANDKGSILAAICAAPSVLGKYGLLKGKEAVCYPGYESELMGASLSEGTVAVSENIITGKAAGAAHEFAFKIVELLKSKATAQEVKGKMFY